MVKKYKYIIGGIAVLAIAIAIGINVNLNSQKSSHLSALSLANIETLASGEGGVSCSGSNCCAGYDSYGRSCCTCCNDSKNAVCNGNSCSCL